MSAVMRLLGVVLLGLLGARGASGQEPDRFGHARHDGLFPVCTGCHVVEGGRASLYPEPGQCSGCHDGQDQPRVEWSAPAAHTSLLAFDHGEHARETAAEPIACEGCHIVAGSGRMDVVARAEVSTCLSCHAHEAEDHLTGARCESCHRPLAEVALPVDRVLALPAPASHALASFALEHADGRGCDVCHTRERCTTCHVNANRVEEIRALAPAGMGLELPTWTARYPEPATHDARSWNVLHGAAAAEPADCATCHTREGCLECHAAPAPQALAALPSRAESPAPGAQVSRMRPAGHGFADFERTHAVEASASPSSCTACHAREQCTECHDAARAPAYHPNGFLDRHAVSAFGRRLECANCHDAEVFCTDCHRNAGRTPVGASAVSYHDAEPIWLLRHGQAARQGMESCVSCHRQQDCLQCHSQLGAFRVNPHGRDFDAERAYRRNPSACRACHLRNPIGGGE